MRYYISDEMRRLSVSHDPADWLRCFEYELCRADELKMLSARYPRTQVLGSLVQIGLDTAETCDCEERDTDYATWHGGHVAWNTQVWRMLQAHSSIRPLRTALLRGMRSSSDEWVCGIMRPWAHVLLENFLRDDPSPEWVDLGA